MKTVQFSEQELLYVRESMRVSKKTCEFSLNQAKSHDMPEDTVKIMEEVVAELNVILDKLA